MKPNQMDASSSLNPAVVLIEHSRRLVCTLLLNLGVPSGGVRAGIGRESTTLRGTCGLSRTSELGVGLGTNDHRSIAEEISRDAGDSC